MRIEDVKVDGVRFPEATEEDEKQLAAFLEQEIPKWELTISLDRLLTRLEIAGQVQSEAEQLNNAPPKILFAEHPAILITIDGAPELRAVESSSYMRVINTPFMIVLDTGSTRYYLDGGEIWYIADEVMGPWERLDEPPAAIVALRPEQPPDSQPLPDESAEEEQPEDTRIPEIIVATEPTELIVSDGEPKYTPIPGTDLSYLSDSESDVLMEIDTIPASSPVYNVKYVYIYDSTPEVIYVGYYPGYTGSYVYHGSHPAVDWWDRGRSKSALDRRRKYGPKRSVHRGSVVRSRRIEGIGEPRAPQPRLQQPAAWLEPNPELPTESQRPIPGPFRRRRTRAPITRELTASPRPQLEPL